MKHVTITAKDALAAVEKAVEERGAGYRYRDYFRYHDGHPMECRYVVYLEEGACVGDADTDGADRQPGCLVGLALHNIDPDLTYWAEGRGNDDRVLGLFSENNTPLGAVTKNLTAECSYAGYPIKVTVTPKALRLLQTAQDVQDKGGTWGNALENGRKAMTSKNPEKYAEVDET